MTDTSPRRPIVPGPSGIAAKAVALREEKAREVFAERPPLPIDAPLYRVSGPTGKIAGAIAGVMAEIGSIAKGGYNKFHNYHYARMEDLLHVLTPLMGKHGLAVFQTEIEIKTVENRIAITYEFTVAHTSGERMEGLRQTGMCIARNSKGDYDDKAINKCHTQARKYFLLSLFQVPTGDFEEADEGPYTNQRQEKAPVPGATTSHLKKITPEAKARASAKAMEEGIAPERTATEQAAEQARRTVPGPTPAPEPISPYKITPLEKGAEAWLTAYLTRINFAKDADEITKLDHYNDMILQKLSDEHPALYNQIDVAIQARLAQLPAAEAPPDVMPDPLSDTQDSMNWIATKLNQQTTQGDLEKFWNEIVAPQETAFDDMDWQLLLQEFKRHEARLAKPVDDEPEPG